jgi:hypothetical protein
VASGDLGCAPFAGACEGSHFNKVRVISNSYKIPSYAFSLNDEA